MCKEMTSKRYEPRINFEQELLVIFGLIDKISIQPDRPTCPDPGGSQNSITMTDVIYRFVTGILPHRCIKAIKVNRQSADKSLLTAVLNSVYIYMHVQIYNLGFGKDDFQN